MTGSPGRGLQLGDDVVPCCATDEDPAHRPGIANARVEPAALVFGAIQVGQIRPVALAGMDDPHARRPKGRQHGSDRRDGVTQERHVVTQSGAEAAGLQEIALHVDNDQRGPGGDEREIIGPGRNAVSTAWKIKPPGLGPENAGAGCGAAWSRR